MLSNISDERLIVGAVNGNQEAMEKLKERIITGQYGIRATLKIPCSDAEKKMLEQHIAKFILYDLHKHRFTGSIQTTGFRYTSYFVIQYRDNNEFRLSDIDSPKEKVVLTTNNDPEEPKHPPLEEIDLEIRTLVSLLNQSPDIKTYGSCSGHPQWQPDKWAQYGGYLGIGPISSPRKTLDFLVGMLTQLDNTGTPTNNAYLPAALQIEDSTRNDNTIYTEAIRKRYKQTDAENLYCSGAPIVLIRVYFRFYVCHREENHSLEIWKQLIARIKELIPEDGELTTEVDTPEMAMQLLQKALHRLPFLFSATLTTSQEGYPGIVLNTVADLALLQWFSTLADRLHECLDNAGYVSCPNAEDDMPYAEKWTFTLQPFLNQECIPLPHLLTPQWEPRTREDHMKIWKLLELTVAEQLKSEDITVKTENT